jgi:multidrug efflux system outer membrane protein
MCGLKVKPFASGGHEIRFRLSDLGYRSGVASYLEILDSQRALFVFQQGLAQTRLAYFQNQVALYKALGGGAAPTAP